MMYLKKKPTNRSSDISPYQKCVLSHFSGQQPDRSQSQYGTERTDLTEIDITHNLNEIGDKQQPTPKTSRWTRTHYIPNSFAMSIRAYTNKTPEHTYHRVSRPSALASTDTSAKPPVLRAQAKQAFDRMFRSAKRTLTGETFMSKSVNADGSTRTKSAQLKRRSNSKKLTISYPMRLHHPDFSFIASQDPWAYGTSDAVVPLRRSVTCALSRPSRPSRIRQSATLRRSLTTRRAPSPTPASSEADEVPERPSAPEPADASSSEDYSYTSSYAHPHLDATPARSSTSSKSKTNKLDIRKPNILGTDDSIYKSVSSISTSEINRILRGGENRILGTITTSTPSSISSFPCSLSGVEVAGISVTDPPIESTRTSTADLRSPTPSVQDLETRAVEHWSPPLLLNNVEEGDHLSSEWYSDLMSTIEKTLGRKDG